MTTENQVALPPVIEGKFNIALTECKFQKYSDELSALVFNEDNVELIQEKLLEGRKIIKKIEDVHAAGKAPSLKVCRDWDEAKRIFLKQVNDIIAVPQQQFTSLAQRMAKAKQEQLENEARIKRIKDGIEANAIAFAKAIAACMTSSDLTKIESKINLEKTRKSDYQEYLSEATERYSELNKLVKSQKVVIKNLEEMEKHTLQAMKDGDDEKALALQDSMEEIKATIEENQVTVQDIAIEQAINSNINYAPVIQMDAPKARRTTWKYEIQDMKVVTKKAPELLTISINDEAVKAAMKVLKDMKAFDGKTEYIHNGIRFYLNETF